MTTVALLFGILFPLYLSYSVWSWYRLSHILGLFWIIRESLLGRQPMTLRDVTNQYGQCQGNGDPEVLRKIMSVRSAYSRGPCEN